MRTSTPDPVLHSREPSLKPLQLLVAADLEAVNRVIVERMQSPVALIPRLAGHIVAGGGKRMRPMLTIACARAVGARGNAHHLLAAAVEFIHTATLLHDDVVDESGRRRGRVAANIIWGNSPSVLVGDFLFSRAFELMVEAGNLDVLRILSHASAVISAGEVAQLTARRNIETPKATYIEVIDAKTAALFAAACEVAPAFAGSGPAVEDGLRAYGRFLGIAFQLVDDAIDYVSDPDTLGKDIGDDFRDGKVTLPVILAYQRGDAAARTFWEQAIAGRANGAEELQEARTRLVETGAIRDTFLEAHAYADKALAALAVLPEGEARAALAEAALFAVDRAY